MTARLSFAVAALLLAGVVPPGGQGGDRSEQADVLARRAMRLAQSGASSEAEALLRRAVRLRPDDPAPAALLGGVLGMRGKLDEAREVFSQAVRLDPANLELRRNLAVSQWQTGRLAEARGTIETVLEATPNDRRSLLLAGMIADNVGDYALAVQRFSQAGDLVDRQAESVLALSRSLYALRQIEEARKALGRLDRARPEPQDFARAGETALEAEDYASARNLFAAAARSGHPQPDRMAFNLALSELRLGRFERARAALEEQLNRAPELGEAWNLLGWRLQKSGDLDGAVRALQQAVAVEPSSEKHHLALGMALTARRRTWHIALETAERAVRRFPNSFRAHQLKGLVHVRQQHFLDAVASYQRAFALRQDSADVRLGLTVSLWASGQERRAFAMAGESIDRFPDNALLRHQLARMQLKRAERGDPAAAEQAAALLQEAVSLEPGLAEAHYDLGNLALRRGDLRQALASLRQAAELAPQARRTHYALARCLRRLGRGDEAALAMKTFERLAESEETAERMAVSP